MVNLLKNASLLLLSSLTLMTCTDAFSVGETTISSRRISTSSFPTQVNLLRSKHYSHNTRPEIHPSRLHAVNDNEIATIQILMSDTGGGHRASANALRDAFDELYPGKIECDIVDIFTDYGPFFPLDSFVPIYKILATYTFLWGWLWYSGATSFGLWFNELMLELFCFEPFKECMCRPSGSTNRRADMVVSVHPLTQDIPLKILNFLDSQGNSRTEGRATPFATVVTDLGGAHPTWFNPGVDTCFVPSDALYQCARDRDVLPEQLVQHGLPIRKGFWAEPLTTTSNSEAAKKSNLLDNITNLFGRDSRDITSNRESILNEKEQSSLRDKLDLVKGLPTVLIVGGGDGMGGIIEQARAVGKKLNDKANDDIDNTYQMVVVCGKNENAKEILCDEDWGEGVEVQVKGFVNNMDEWMRASDVIVTKAGPGTIAEASICGLPCMLSSFLPGQEEGNIPYVEDAGFGSFSGDPNTIADTVSSWLSSPDKLAKMKEAALQAARPSATVDIAKDLANMLFEHKKNQATNNMIRNKDETKVPIKK